MHFLLIVYLTLPLLAIYWVYRKIYQEHDSSYWHILYMVKFLCALSFLPLLAFSSLDLALVPKNNWSIIFIIITFILAILGIGKAKKEKVVMSYSAGVMAAFMEEILYRGIIFGLLLATYNNYWFAAIISSIGFGFWHLKNFPWHGNKKITWIQFFYTMFVYGPIFSILRIWTGDIYLAILYHYIIDATCALAPNWMRGWLVLGGREEYYMDSDKRIKL